MSENRAQEITSKLWAMANELRGNMAADEYRNYILGFMFYRYLSENQLDHLRKSDLLTGNTFEELNKDYLEQAVGDELQDFLMAIAEDLGYAIEPEYTWQSITDKVNNNTLKPEDFQEMFNRFNDNTKINTNAEQDFSGVFADINLGNSRLGNNTNQRAKSLMKIVNLVDQFEYNDESGHDILGDVYEYLIAKFAGNSGKKAGEFYTPHQVSQVLARLATASATDNGEPFSVYDAAMGSGSLLLTVQGELSKQLAKKIPVRFYGQELNTTTYNLARMNLMMHHVPYQNMTLSNADTLEEDWPKRKNTDGSEGPQTFDAVVMNPPYSQKWDNDDRKLKDPRFGEYGALPPRTKADYAFVLHGLYHLKDSGTMAIVLPHGVLFRGAKEGKIRQALIDKNRLDAVIGLPAGLFYSTSIPTVILVLKKKRERKDIFFIDASKDFEKGKNQNLLRETDIDKIVSTYLKREDVDKYAHDASLDEIKENEYNLNIPRYVDTFEEEPPVDIKKVVAEIQETNKKIKELNSSILEDLNDLVGSDEQSNQEIELLKELFKNE
ncbi:type I restriction-modification system subunit M [Lactobacillus sp. ESL0703]|uniref:type I restriction-modification system subunit M n=1 Tax=Lactobacillus sp. ESL0703 TaxID=2983218 RepID=UPI0023F922E4|nr:type I restriction-modification system subunit M [Lactobacillus sp. ESL0703]MDF7668115.1 type I restriction-modification system subunit M [Lactobacillus sp. ESL0703]